MALNCPKLKCSLKNKIKGAQTLAFDSNFKITEIAKTRIKKQSFPRAKTGKESIVLEVCNVTTQEMPVRE